MQTNILLFVFIFSNNLTQTGVTNRTVIDIGGRGVTGDRDEKGWLEGEERWHVRRGEKGRGMS